MSEKDFLAADPALAVGTRHAGFTVTGVERLPEISGHAYLMRHDASGARALWLACADGYVRCVDADFELLLEYELEDVTGMGATDSGVNLKYLDRGEVKFANLSMDGALTPRVGGGPGATGAGDAHAGAYG